MSAKVKDLVERAAATFVQAFAAVVAVDGFDVGSSTAWKAAAVAGVLAVAKWAVLNFRA